MIVGHFYQQLLKREGFPLENYENRENKRLKYTQYINDNSNNSRKSVTSRILYCTLRVKYVKLGKPFQH